MPLVSDDYRDAERSRDIPPVSSRGRTNENPKGIGFWALVAEDFRTHDRNIFEQGFWAVFSNRFGNWRMGQPKLIRAPSTVLYWILFKLTEMLGGISLWYTVKLGRRVRIWHHSGVVIGARAIGDDAHIRQNTTIGVGQTLKNDDLPIIGDRVDIGAGACIAGAVCIGDDVKIGGNALVINDIPSGATVIGNPAEIVAMTPPSAKTTPTPSAPSTDAPATNAPPTGAETTGEAPRATAALAPQVSGMTAAASASAALAAEPMRRNPVAMGKVALLGSANLDYLSMSLKEAAATYGLELDTVVPDFGTARMALLAPFEASDLQQAMAQDDTATLIAERSEDVLAEVFVAPLRLPADELDRFLDNALEPLLSLVVSAREKLKGPVFVLKLAAFGRSSLGLADAAAQRGRAAIIRRANEKIAEEIADLADVHLIETGDLIAEIGQNAADPGEYWHMGRLPFSEAFNALLARRLIGALLSLRGKTARILMIDLDNTLWGGVLGEDGIEGVQIGGPYPGSAYAAFQSVLRALADRGIALALTSKNDEDLALKMIEEHPEMVLRPSDFIAYRIDWTEKSLNIQTMLDEIGLGAGSCMFIDDNPVEREKVRENIPDCIVPAFPDSPEKLAAWLLDNPYLETLELTSSDLKRTAQYKVRSKVNADRRSFQNVEDFYRDLDMKLTFEPLNKMNHQRVLQLFVKTNQFNATTRRHDAEAVRKILEEGGELYAVGVEDRYLGYELMGVIVLRTDASMAAAYPTDAVVQAADRSDAWWVDSFVMSCRILGRTVENAILAWATQRVAALGGGALIGQIIETPRNTPVRKVFEKSGFEALATSAETGAGGLWIRAIHASGPVALPDYFTIATPAADAARPKPAQPNPLTGGPAEARPAQSTLTAQPQPATPAAEDNPELAAVFRDVFRLSEQQDLSTASMDSLEAWDSLAHLKLMMAVERRLGVRLSGGAIGEIRSYVDLNRAVADKTLAGASA